jgi:hypothetical protein
MIECYTSGDELYHSISPFGLTGYSGFRPDNFYQASVIMGSSYSYEC